MTIRARVLPRYPVAAPIGMSIVTTRAAALLLRFPISITGIITNGYNQVGDGGGARYIAGSSSGPGAWQDASDRWFELDLSTGFVDPRWLGLVVGEANSDTAFAATLAVAEAENVTLQLPPGQINLSGHYLLDWHGAAIVGVRSGYAHALSVINYSGSSTFLTLYKAADSNGITGAHLSNFFIIGAGTSSKIAILIENASNTLLDNIQIQNLTGGTTSVGIYLAGRELTTIRDCLVEADVPIFIGLNPDRASFLNIDCDQLNVVDFSAIAMQAGRHIVTVQDGANLSNVSFTGRQAWSGGLDGLSWVDTIATQTSYNIRLENIRHEQAHGGYSFRIDRSGSPTRLLNFSAVNCQTALANHGFWLKGVEDTIIDSHLHTGGSSTTAITTDGTACRRLSIRGCFWQDGSLAGLVGMEPIWTDGHTTTAALPATGEFLSTVYGARSGMWRGLKSTTTGYRAFESIVTYDVANGTTGVSLSPFAAFTVLFGTIEVSSATEGGIALFSTSGVTKISGSANFDTSGNAGTLSIVWASATSVKIVNRLGSDSPITIRMMLTILARN